MRLPVLVVLIALAIVASATADTILATPQHCGTVGGGRYTLRANTHTSCPFAVAIWRKLTTEAKRRGRPSSGLIRVASPVTGTTYAIDCNYTATGRDAYVCGGLPDGAPGGDVFLKVERLG